MGNTVHMEYSPAETQPISDTIQWHNSYKTTNQLPFPVIVLKPVAVMQWHRCYIYRDITLPIWYHSLSGLRGCGWELNWYLLFPPDGNNSPIIPA